MARTSSLTLRVLRDPRPIRGHIVRSWTEHYYDAMEHYAWSPERLGHKSDPAHTNGKPAEVLLRLRRVEEPMNHLLSVFFSLAPSSLVHDLFRQFVSMTTSGDLALMGRKVERELQLGSLSQPDFAFDSPTAFLTIECKVGPNKSSYDQLLKYAALHARAENKNPGRVHGLLFVTPSAREHLFPIPFTDWSALKRDALAYLPTITKGALRAAKPTLVAEIGDGLSLLNVGHCTYRDLAEVIDSYATGTDSDGVARRLCSGLVTEIDSRNLR